MKWFCIVLLCLSCVGLALRIESLESQIKGLNRGTNEIWKSIDRITAAIEGKKNAE